eukprot:172292_1
MAHKTHQSLTQLLRQNHCLLLYLHGHHCMEPPSSLMHEMELTPLWESMKRFKIYILNEHDRDTAPSTLADTVLVLRDIHEKKNLGLCFDLYSRLQSAINHGMWLEVWNSMAGVATSGKMHEKKAPTVSYKLNVKINGPILALVDLRVPAAKYTIKVARRPKTKGKAPLQYQYHDILRPAHLKATVHHNNKKRHDSRKKASEFFKIKLQ